MLVCIFTHWAGSDGGDCKAARDVRAGSAAAPHGRIAIFEMFFGGRTLVDRVALRGYHRDRIGQEGDILSDLRFSISLLLPLL